MYAFVAQMFPPIRPAPPRSEGVREAPPIPHNIPALPAPSSERSEPRPPPLAPDNDIPYIPPYIGSDQPPLDPIITVHANDAGTMMPNGPATQGGVRLSLFTSSVSWVANDGVICHIGIPVEHTNPNARGGRSRNTSYATQYSIEPTTPRFGYTPSA